MVESLAEPRKRLALDTDWQSALLMVSLFALCGSLSTGTLLRIIRGTRPGTGVGWQSWLLLAMCMLWFFGTNEHWWRLVSAVVALGPASRILLHLLKADVEIQIANAAFLRVFDLMLSVGGCAYVAWWFKSKFRYV